MVSINTHENSFVDRLFTITLYKTKNRERAQNSKFTYGVEGEIYTLRILGVLNGLFGLELIVHDRGVCNGDGNSC